jgi:hypothetical protein
MVDGQKPQTLLHTLNVTNQNLYCTLIFMHFYSIDNNASVFGVLRAFIQCDAPRIKTALGLQWVMRDYQIYRCYTSTEQEI